MINETVPAVVAEYRRDLHDMIVKKQYMPTADYLTRLLDRIEAADNSADGRRMQCTAPGNAKAMRDALEDVLEKIDRWRTDGVMEHWQYSQLFDIADAALSAPARNCDKYDNFNDALRQFVKERPETKKIDEQGRSVATAETYCVFANWLLAPAAERKGEDYEK